MQAEGAARARTGGCHGNGASAGNGEAGGEGAAGRAPAARGSEADRPRRRRARVERVARRVGGAAATAADAGERWRAAPAAEARGELRGVEEGLGASSACGQEQRGAWARSGNRATAACAAGGSGTSSVELGVVCGGSEKREGAYACEDGETHERANAKACCGGRHRTG